VSKGFKRYHLKLLYKHKPEDWFSNRCIVHLMTNCKASSQTSMAPNNTAQFAGRRRSSPMLLS